MEKCWIIKRFNKGIVEYFLSGSDDEMVTDKVWKNTSIHFCSKFTTKEKAVGYLARCREEFHWGGIFQIEEIYISR